MTRAGRRLSRLGLRRGVSDGEELEFQARTGADPGGRRLRNWLGNGLGSGRRIDEDRSRQAQALPSSDQLPEPVYRRFQSLKKDVQIVC